MQSYIFLTICCIAPLIFLTLLGLGLTIAFAKRKNDKFAVKDYFSKLLTWFNIFTGRSVLAIISGVIFMLIAISTEELSIFASISIFLITTSLLFVTIAFIVKVYLTIRQNFSPSEKALKTTLGSTEITENDPNKIRIEINSKIPPGYILRIDEKLPEKLGGNFRAIATAQTFGTEKKTIIEGTIPYTRRGVYEIGPARFIYHDVFGLSRITMVVPNRFNLTILPEIPQIEKFNFNLTSEKGEEEKVITAQINTEDFFNIRPYVTGDDTRRVHWKLTAKRDTLMIRLPENTTISFKKLIIFIVNTMPRIDSREDNFGYSAPYIMAAEYALDTQIKVASAMVDFALRLNIPTKVIYFQNGKLVYFEPLQENPYSWKYTMTKIKMDRYTPDFSLLDQVIEENTVGIVTTSELSTKIADRLIGEIKKTNADGEIMYCPVSSHIKDLIKEPERKQQNFFLKAVEWIFLTKPYFNQTTPLEKMQNLLQTRKEKYYMSDLNSCKSLEQRVIDTISANNIKVREFYMDDSYASESDNIVNILENES